MTTTRHTITRYGTENPSNPSGVGQILDRQAAIMERAGRSRAFAIRWGRADLYGPLKRFSAIQSRTRELMEEHHWPDGLLYTLGVASWHDEDEHIRPIAKVHRVDVGFPIADTVGTPAIDRIHGATFATWLDEPGGVYSLGIYANKPGEHSVSNAEDYGAAGRTADEIHERILERAEWTRQRMLLDIQGEPGGLPVNGIIVLEQYCSRENTSWRYYSGTPHVSHWHVSGWPNPLPGWI